MTRRELFATLPACSVLAAAAAPASMKGLVPSPETNLRARGLYWLSDEHPLRKLPRVVGWYRGYALAWTGWKTSQATIVACAQWIAVPLTAEQKPDFTPGVKWLYSSFPGDTATFREGYVFDYGVRRGQEVAYYGALLRDDEREGNTHLIAAKADTLKRLLGAIDAHIQG